MRRHAGWLVVLALVLLGGCERLLDSHFHTKSDDGAVSLPAGLNPASLRIESAGHALDANYVEAPASTQPLLLILHGNGENVADWGRAQLLLREHGFSSLVFDYSGFGRSAGRPTIGQFHADALAAYARAVTLATPARGVVVVAHSLGTYIALDAAAEMQPPPSSLVLWGVFAGLRRDIAWKGGFKAILALLIPDAWDNERALPGLKMPILILHGERDSVVPEAETAALVRKGGVNVTYRSMPGAAHNALYKPADAADWQPILAFAAEHARHGL